MKLFKNKLKSDPSFCMFQTHKALVFTIISKVFLSMSRTSCCVVGKMTIISRCKNEKVLELIAILFCCLQWATLSPELVASSQWRSHWGQGGKSAPLDSKKFAKDREKEGGNQEKREKEEKIGEKRQIGKVLSLCPSWQIGLATLLQAVKKMYKRRAETIIFEV